MVEHQANSSAGGVRGADTEGSDVAWRSSSPGEKNGGVPCGTKEGAGKIRRSPLIIVTSEDQGGAPRGAMRNVVNNDAEVEKRRRRIRVVSSATSKMCLFEGRLAGVLGFGSAAIVCLLVAQAGGRR